MKEKLKEKENKMSMNVLMLESVGSCIDTDNMVYPLDTNNNPDFDMGVHVGYTTDEWSTSLSEEDAGLLNDWLLKYNYKVKGDK